MMMMKVKLFTVGLTLGATMLLSNCNDDISLVGPSIQPESDKITVFQDSIRFKASTVQLDSIYARTVNGLLGELYDPLYGNLKSDYICQFYCPEGFKFKHTPIDGRIDSMIYQITYSSWVGDSLAPMQVQIYQVTKPLLKDYYTNIDPADFCNMQTSLGTKTYTAYDTSIPDWQREITDTSDPDYYVPHVHVRMPQSLGQHIYDETLNNPASFETQEAFNNFFPGLYVTTTYGTGNILDVRSSSMLIYYRYNGTSSETGNDTIYTTIERFNTTQEVIQPRAASGSRCRICLYENARRRLHQTGSIGRTAQGYHRRPYREQPALLPHAHAAGRLGLRLRAPLEPPAPARRFGEELLRVRKALRQPHVVPRDV